MTDLERRALLGDRQAQDELSQQFAMLPCPICRKTVFIEIVRPHSEQIGRLKIEATGGAFIECACGYSISGESVQDVIKKHNTRPEPPIGRCKDCAVPEKWENGEAICSINNNVGVCENDFCNEFEPKEE